MDIDRLEKDVKKLREKTAEITSGFSYYQQELIRRVFKSVLPQIKDKQDISTAKEILERTEWLDDERA